MTKRLTDEPTASSVNKPPPPGGMRKLTAQHKAFAAAVAAGSSLRDAAISAGYKASDARSRGSKLADDPLVAAEIDRIQAKGEAVAIGSKAEALDMVWRTMAAAADEGDRVNVYRGVELWLKATGQLVEKQQIEQTSQVVQIDWSLSEGGSE